MEYRRYKYFCNIDYAKQFMDGTVHHKTLAYFRDYEDKVIGDEFESTRIFRPVEGLQINNQTQGTFRLPMGFASSARAEEIYIFCFSLKFTEKLKQEFQAKACVEILKPAKFINRWIKALQKIFPAAKYFARKVDYYLPEDLPGAVWQQPDLIATSKLKSFSYQQEYRLGFSVTGALDFGQTSQQFIDRKARPMPKPDEHGYKNLELGDLRDICILHTLRGDSS